MQTVNEFHLFIITHNISLEECAENGVVLLNFQLIRKNIKTNHLPRKHKKTSAKKSLILKLEREREGLLPILVITIW